MFLANTLFWSYFRYSIHFFFFCKSLLFSFFSCLSLDYLSHLLNSMLNIVGLYHLFQVGQEPLLLFVPPLYLSSLLFKYLSIVLGNIRENGGRYNNTEEKQKKKFLFIYCWLRYYHKILWINSIGLWKLSLKREILSYTKSTYPENTSP